VSSDQEVAESFPNNCLERVWCGCVLMVLKSGALQQRWETLFVVFHSSGSSSMLGIKGESIALYPLKAKAAWFAGSRPMFS